MKGFLVFFVITIGLLVGVIAYELTHPSRTTMVRQGANWVLMEQNASQIEQRH